MDEKKLYVLFSVVRNNGDVKRLLNEGLSYKEIADATNLLIKEGFISYEEDSIKLSELGEERYEELDKKFKMIDKTKWIKPEIESRIPKFDKNDVFLPKQDDLWFN